MSKAFHVEHATRSSRAGSAVLAIAFLVLAAAPFFAGRDDLRLLSEIFAYVALASLWNLLAGYAGLVSVGQQAFVGLGGYLMFALSVQARIDPLPAIPLAGIARGLLLCWAGLALTAGTPAFVYLVLRSRHGLALGAIRSSESAAASVGIDIV